MKSMLPIIILFIVSTGFSQSLAEGKKTDSKKNQIRMTVAGGLIPASVKVKGIVRHFYLHIPKNLRKRKPVSAPVVFYLHGGGPSSDALSSRISFKLDKLADREGFVVVYPNGLGNQWNDARVAEFEKRMPAQFADDVAFIDGIIRGLTKAKIADPKRIYMTGASNGGMMIYTLACKIAHKLAAIAPAMASMPVELRDSCKPKQPLPILIFNGADDQIIPWQGGRVSPMRKHDLGYVLSVDHTIRLWRGYNGCSKNGKKKKLAHKDAKDPTHVEVFNWSDCKNGSEVVVYKIVGGGHNWPGSDMSRKPEKLRRYLGVSNQDIDPKEELWKFFKRHKSP